MWYVLSLRARVLLCANLLTSIRFEASCAAGTWSAEGASACGICLAGSYSTAPNSEVSRSLVRRSQTRRSASLYCLLDRVAHFARPALWHLSISPPHVCSAVQAVRRRAMLRLFAMHARRPSSPGSPALGYVCVQRYASTCADFRLYDDAELRAVSARYVCVHRSGNSLLFLPPKSVRFCVGLCRVWSGRGVFGWTNSVAARVLAHTRTGLCCGLSSRSLCGPKPVRIWACCYAGQRPVWTL
jgi:hypothetical protein